MKLLTKKIISLMPGPRAQENEKDPTVIAKFFSCANGWTWYAYEGWKYLHRNGEFVAEVPINYELKENETFEKDEKGRDYVFFFGKVHGFATELGTFTLNDFMDVNESHPLGIERDKHFEPKPLSKCDPTTGN